VLSSGSTLVGDVVASLGKLPATQDGQREHVLSELQQWGHTPEQAQAIASQADGVRLHTLVFEHFRFEDGQFRWKPGVVLSDQDRAQLFQLCQTWLEQGDHAACMPLLSVALTQENVPVALWHALACQLPPNLLGHLLPRHRAPLLAGIQRVASQGWLDKSTPCHVPKGQRERIDQFVKANDRKAWALLCLTTAQQRALAAHSLSPGHVGKHLGRLIQAHELLPAERQDEAMVCAESLMAKCQTTGPQAGKLQALREDLQNLRERHLLVSNQRLVDAMKPWLSLELTPPTGIQPFQLDDQNGLLFNAKFLIRQKPAFVQAAQKNFQAWVRLQFNSPQGLPSEQLFKVLGEVAGTPGSPEWSPPEVELERATRAAEAPPWSGDWLNSTLLQLDPKRAFSPAQLKRFIAISSQPQLSQDARFALLEWVCHRLPSRSSAPELHRLWLQAALSPSAPLHADYRYSLLESGYRRAHPGALDDAPTQRLIESMARNCWKKRSAQATDPLEPPFQWLTQFDHRPADGTDWQAWRVLAAHWLHELFVRQDPSSSEQWAQVVQKIQLLTEANKNQPHEGVPRLTQLLSDLVALLPPAQRLTWLQALEQQCALQLGMTGKTTATASLVSLGALCGAARALIGVHGGTPSSTTPTGVEREIELLRQCSQAVLLQEAGQTAQAARKAAAVIDLKRQQLMNTPLAQQLDTWLDAWAQSYSQQ